jgi:Flp pilus assembly protein TadG
MMYHRRHARRRGVAAVELALLVTFLLLPLLLGLWDVGRLVEVEQLVQNAAREGGRQASTGKRSVSDVQQAVVDYLARDGITLDPSAVTVTNLTDGTRTDPRAGSSPQNALQLDHFEITVSVPINSVRWVLMDRFSGATTLTATADWYSMNDLPFLVSPTIPSQPQ